MREDALQSLLLDGALVVLRHLLKATDFPHATRQARMTLPFDQRQYQMRVKNTHPYNPPKQPGTNPHLPVCGNRSRRHREPGTWPARQPTSPYADMAFLFGRGRLTARFRLAGNASTG